MAGRIAVAERAVAELTRQGASGDVHVTGVAGLTAEFTAGKLRNCSADGRMHLAVRASRSGRIGFYSTTDASVPGDAVARALEIAGCGEELEVVFPAATAPGRNPAPAVYDPELDAVTPAALVSRISALAEQVQAVTPGAQVRIIGRRETEDSVLLNTAGAVVCSRQTALVLFFELARFSADDVLLLWQEIAATRLEEPAVEGFAARLGELYAAATTPASLAPGKRRVVFAPEAAHTLLGPIYHGINGLNAVQGTSPLSGKADTQVMDCGFTLTDEPWLDWAPGSALWDDEGTPTEPRHVFEAGVFRGFLHDLRSAAMGETRSTGNGRRARGQAPRIAPYTLAIEPGNLPFGELLAEAGEGLYVASVIGGGPGALAGAFSHPVGVGYLIREGRLAGRVKDIAIAGNVYELGRHGLVGLEDRAHTVGAGGGGVLRVPHILLDGVNVSGK